jgi:hypothetical protein
MNRRMRLLYRRRSVFWSNVSLSRREGWEAGVFIFTTGSKNTVRLPPTPRRLRSFQQRSAEAYPDRIERLRGSRSISRGWQVDCRHVPPFIFEIRLESLFRRLSIGKGWLNRTVNLENEWHFCRAKLRVVPDRRGPSPVFIKDCLENTKGLEPLLHNSEAAIPLI